MTDGHWDAPGRRRRQATDRVIGGALLLVSAVSVLTTVVMVVVLVIEALGFFFTVSPWEFLAGTTWAPGIEPRSFGVLPLVTGSLLVAVGAGLLAVPVGLLTAIYLSEYARPGVRRIAKPALEVLAGIPTVVYGYFALTFVTPLIRSLVPGTDVYNAASASVVVGIMILPMVSSLSEDALSAVPASLRQGAFALGATKYEVSTRTVLPAALSGVIASFVLALSRAMGETMVVTIAAGATPKMTLNPFTSIETMTAYMVQVSRGELAYGGTEYQTLFAVGLLLFLITLGMNALSHRARRRFREVYE